MWGTLSTATVSGHNQDVTGEQQWATTAVHVAMLGLLASPWSCKCSAKSDSLHMKRRGGTAKSAVESSGPGI